MNIDEFIDQYANPHGISPEQVRLLEVAAILYKEHYDNTDEFDPEPLGVAPGDEITDVNYVSPGASGAGVLVMGGYQINLIQPDSNSKLKGAPVGDLDGWEDRTFAYYDSDIGMHHELSHVILGLLGVSTPSGPHGPHSELMVASLARVAKEAGIESLSDSATEAEMIQLAERVRELYGLSNHKDSDGAYQEFIFANSAAQEPSNYNAVLPQLLAWANGPDGSYENLFNANRNFYAESGLDTDSIPSGYRNGYVFHEDSADANEDKAWRTYAAGTSDGADGKLQTLIEENESVAWLGNQYDNVMSTGDGRDYIDGGKGDDELDGADGHDRLLGGDGDDRLIGGGGTDHLEGGTGLDTYHLATDGSVDTILDVDGLGEIEIDGESITGTYSIHGWDDGSYHDADDHVKLTVDGNDLRLYQHDGEAWQAVGRVQDWESGELGLTLDDTPFEPGEGPGGEARQTLEATDATRFTKIWGNAAPLDVFINNGRKSWSSGSSGDDRFYLGTDNDIALGGQGHDLLVGGPGRDYLSGGPSWGGADVAANDHDAVIGGPGIDILDGGVGDDTLIAMDNPDQRLSGGSGGQGEWLMGNDGDDRLYGSNQSDVLTGGAGNDEMRGGEGRDILLGDAHLLPSRRHGAVTGSGITREWTWDDSAGSYAQTLTDAFSLYRDDSFEWTADFDATDYTLDPTYGFMTNQRVADGGGNDILHGEGGDDFIAGQTGDDMLYGGDGDDILYGDDSQPLPDGSATGNDILHAGAGADRLYGGQGDDVLYADEDDGDRDELYGGEDMDVLYGGTGGDRLDGGAGGDILEAGPDGSELFGGEGNDYLQGGAGDDTLDGGIDDDSYRLSGGADRIDDAAGNDAYLISADSLTDAASVTEIADSDGLGRLVFDGERIEADTLEAVDDSHWEAKNGRYRLHLTGGTLVITAEPAADHPGQVRVLDFSDGDFGLTLPEPVDDSNHPPETGATLADQSIDEASAFDYQLPADAFSDPDGDALSLAARQSSGDPLPGWLAFDAASATFTGTPGDADVGDLSIQVTATDPDGETASQTFALTVNDINQAPQADTALTAQTVDEDTAFAYTLPADAFSDPDGDALSLEARQSNGDPLPGWLAFDASTATFTGTPANGDVGDLSIEVTATDPDGEAASQAFDLTVNNVNDAPEVGTALSDATVETGDAWTYALPDDAFTDVDAGDSLSLAAQQSNGDPLPDWLAFDPGDATFSGTPGEGDIADLSLDVTATDQAGASVSQTFGLNVQAGMETVTGDDGDNWLFGGGGDERIRGGAGDDTLYAGGGNDHIHGGTGDDQLIGGFGDDTYHVERGDGEDRITETGWIGGEDTLAFGRDIAPDQLWFSRDGRDLSIDIIGTEDSVTVTDWFGWLGRESVERIEVSSGGALAAAEVNNLVQAMASFDPPGADETSIPSDYRDQLEPVIAAAWQ